MADVTVKLRYVRHSAKKLQPVGRAFVGQKLTAALNSTAVMPQDSARFLRQALRMAEAAAGAKELNADQLVVKAVMAGIGPKIKRMRPNARGRANNYQKHLAHLSVTIGEIPEVKKAVKTKKVKTQKENS